MAKLTKETKKPEAVDAVFEIVETKIVKASEESKGVQVFNPENKEQVIQAFINAASLSFTTTPAQCKKLVRESSKLKIVDKDDKDGYKKVYEKYREFVKLRTGTEKERLVLTEPFNKIKNGIDVVAKKDILGYTEKEEARLKSMVDQWKQWEKDEEERIQREEEEKLSGRVKALEEVGLKFDGSFYSIGDTISVDVNTIKDFTEESFLDFKNRVSLENDAIIEANRISALHNERREMALPFFAYWTPEEHNINFGEIDEDIFSTFLSRIKKAHADFKQQQKDQEAEAERQRQERKDFNFERRSFLLEKEAFEYDEKIGYIFRVDGRGVSFSREDLENISKEDWEVSFESALKTKRELQEEKTRAEDQKKEAAENEAKMKVFNSRKEALLNLGLKHREDKQYFIFGTINVNENTLNTYSDSHWADVIVDIKEKKAELEKQAAAEEEAKRLEKMPDVEKAVRYIDGLVKVEIPVLKTPEIESLLKEFTTTLLTKSAETLDKLKRF